MNPDFLAALADALVLAGLMLAPVQLRPEFPVVGTFPVTLFDEHAVGPADHFVDRAGGCPQEVFICRENRSIHLKFNYSLGLAERFDLRLVIQIPLFCGANRAFPIGSRAFGFCASNVLRQNWHCHSSSWFFSVHWKLVSAIKNSDKFKAGQKEHV